MGSAKDCKKAKSHCNQTSIEADFQGKYFPASPIWDPHYGENMQPASHL
jgi:hypothetical protein